MHWEFIKRKWERKSSSTLTAFLFCLLVLGVRAGARLSHAELWAEDGNIFLNETLQFGWRAVFTPHASYFHVIQRLILFGIHSFLPLYLLPTAIGVFSLVTVAYVMSRWVSEDYRWLLPDGLRWGLCFILCLGPGLGEMLGNLCNLNWFFTLWLALLLLRDTRKPIRLWEYGVSLGVLFSIGTGALVLPLAFWRFRKQPKILFGVLAVFFIYTLLLMGVRDPSRTEIPSVHLWEWARTYLRQFRVSVLLQPLFGDALTIRWSLGAGLKVGNYLSILFGLLLIPWCYRNRRDPALQAILIFLFSFSGWVFLVWMGRTLSIKVFQQPLGIWFFDNRYSFPMSWGAFLFWFFYLESWLYRGRYFRFKNLAFLVFLGWVCFTSSYRFFLPALSTERHWARTAPLLESSLRTGCPPLVRIKVFPGEAFHFDYKSGKSNDFCHSNPHG